MPILTNSLHYIPVMRDSGAHAGVNVTTQGVRAVAARLSQDHAVPEVAANGGAAW